MDEKLLMKINKAERVVWPAVFIIGLMVLLYVVYSMPGPNKKLLMAAESGDITSVENLLDNKGADVNTKSEENRTPLMLAAQNGHAAVVKALLARGADVSAKANDNGTALSHAEKGNHPEVAKLLKAAGTIKTPQGSGG